VAQNLNRSRSESNKADEIIMKKTLWLLALLSLSCFVFVSCGGSGSTGGATYSITGDWHAVIPAGNYPEPFGYTEEINYDVRLNKVDNQLIFSDSQSSETVMFDLDQNTFSGVLQRVIDGELFTYTISGTIFNSNLIRMLQIVSGTYNGTPFRIEIEVTLTR